MKIDLHAHTSGISRCCQIPAPKVLTRAKNVGLDGIVLTNHYTVSYVNDGDAMDFAKRYIAEYEYTKKLGDEMGMKVFFGVEVTWEEHPAIHILLYGVTPDFVLAHPEMYNYYPEKLYREVKAVGGCVVQAHPFRNGMTVLDTAYLDGVEVNCHPLYNITYADRLIRIAHESGLIVTCGGDYHADTYRPVSATHLPDDIENGLQIAEFLLSCREIELLIHEPKTEAPYSYTFRRDGNDEK